MPRQIYETIESGEWYTRAKTWDVQCCDCGLVHTEKWRVRKKNKKLVVEFCTLVDRRKTARVRRKHKFVLDDHD